VRRDVSENKIREVPPSIAHLSSLTRLDLHTNLMSELPPEIGALSRVKHL
jgi:Leucine-rich repeat (LRR) protein